MSILEKLLNHLGYYKTTEETVNSFVNSIKATGNSILALQAYKPEDSKTHYTMLLLLDELLHECEDIIDDRSHDASFLRSSIPLNRSAIQNKLLEMKPNLQTEDLIESMVKRIRTPERVKA